MQLLVVPSVSGVLDLLFLNKGVGLAILPSLFAQIGQTLLLFSLNL